jgi:acetyl esterase/lipase
MIHGLRMKLSVVAILIIALPAMGQPARERLGSSGGAAREQAPADARVVRDLAYKQVNGGMLELDLYLPSDMDRPVPVVVWIHGGGWRSGSRGQVGARWLTEHGYAVASISYRFSQQAIFPAQIEDCLAAVRWLRAHADEHGLDGGRIAVAGTSAGGHLAALMGTAADVEEFHVGEHLEHSGRVQAVIDFFGPSDFTAISRPRRGPVRLHAEELLLGGPVTEKLELARAASPVSHIDPDDPPFFIVHGTEDRVVPPRQSELLHEALEAAGVESHLHLIPGGGPWRAGIPDAGAPEAGAGVSQPAPGKRRSQRVVIPPRVQTCHVCADPSSTRQRCQAAIDARQRLRPAEELQALEDRRADGRAADGDADRLGELSEAELLLLAVLLHR